MASLGPQHGRGFPWLLLLGVLLVAALFATILGRPREGVPGVTKTVEESTRR